MKQGIKRRIIALVVGALASIGSALPSRAAERIVFYYGPLGFSVAVRDLEIFAQEGKVEKGLKPYLNRLSLEQQAQLRRFLQSSYEVDPVVIYRFSRTSVGDRLLSRIGEVINFPRGLNGFYGIRGALVQAAAEPEGLTVLNFLQKFPLDIQLNTQQTLNLIEQITSLEKQTARFVDELEQMTVAAAASEPSVKLNQLPDLRKPGSFNTMVQTLYLNDTKRDRALSVDLYLPQKSAGEGSGSYPAQAQVNSSPIPVIVVSNGLGARRGRFQELAQHLASHGFAVVIPDHPGSDRQRQLEFLAGLYKENFEATDFIDRPLDITYILDELERRNSAQIQGKLNLQQVGVFGYSIGGSTALALAGAEIDFEQLEQDCKAQLNLMNISLLYQCRALELPRQALNLRDRRVKAAYLFVPFGNSFFGGVEMSRITIPVLWQAVDKDILTPLLLEHVPSFTALASSDKYLAVTEKLPHTRVTLPTNEAASSSEQQTIAQAYQNVLSLAFFKTYIADDESYLRYLQASYIQALSQEPYRLSLVTSTSDLAKRFGIP